MDSAGTPLDDAPPGGDAAIGSQRETSYTEEEPDGEKLALDT